jgi:transcriptional regulator NrdR family protein
MKCPRCNEDAIHFSTAPGAHRTVVRQFGCSAGHRFSTVETYQPTAPVERHQLAKVLRAIAATFAPKKENTPCP